MSWDKRAFDLICSSLGLVLVSPFFVLIALFIKLDDGGPIFFRQGRIGRLGRPFRMWKFRTMVVDAERQGAQLTVGRDPRITRVGYILRQVKLDELPQLLNVIAGDMSLVGPRPEVQRYVNLYTDDQRRVLDFTPGITDVASIKYRNESELLAAAADPEYTYVSEILPAKIRLNLKYAATASRTSDLIVILQTIFRIVR